VPFVSLDKFVLKLGETSTFTLTGVATHFTKSSNDIKLYNNQSMYPVSNLNVLSDTSLTFDLNLEYGTALGYYNIRLENLFDGIFVFDSIQVIQGDNPPYIVSIERDTLRINDTVNIVFKSNTANFLLGTNVITLLKDGTSYSIGSFDVKNANEMTINLVFESGAREGYYDLIVKNDANNVNYKIQKAVYYLPEPVLGVVNGVNNMEHSPYPNPVVDQFSYDGNFDQITISDFEGKAVRTFSKNDKLDVSGLERGIYLLTVQNADKTKTHKIIVD
jgi:hypothetical protein